MGDTLFRNTTINRKINYCSASVKVSHLSRYKSSFEYSMQLHMSIWRTTHSLVGQRVCNGLPQELHLSPRSDVLIHFIVILKPTFLSRLELGALMSSYLEGALYKFLCFWLHLSCIPTLLFWPFISKHISFRDYLCRLSNKPTYLQERWFCVASGFDGFRSFAFMTRTVCSSILIQFDSAKLHIPDGWANMAEFSCNRHPFASSHSYRCEVQLL